MITNMDDQDFRSLQRPEKSIAFVVHPEVAAALTAGTPVVALESTVITHGLPYPQNVETALAMEKAVRAQGAMAATIAADTKVKTWAATCASASPLIRWNIWPTARRSEKSTDATSPSA